MRTCLLFTEKQASPNALPEMNMNSTPTPSCYADTAWAVTNIYKTDERHVLPSFWLKLAISFFRTKAKNASYIMSAQPFLWPDITKICFLPEHDALFKEFFLPLRSNYKQKYNLSLAQSREIH